MAARRTNTPALEWIAAVIGLVLLLTVFAVIAREALGGATDQLPAIEVRATRVAPAGKGFVVEFEAANTASGTAAAVTVEGKLGDETSTATLDYVPAHGAVKGGLFFTGDPRGQPLALRATGFQTP